MGRYFFAWLFLVSFSGFLLGGSFEATFFRPIEKVASVDAETTADIGDKKKGENLCEEKPFWERTNCDPVAYFTLWLTVFTGILAVSTTGLWVITQFIFRGSEKTSKQQLRAYIFPEEFNMRRFTVNQRPHIQISLKNAGQTPAWNVRCRFDAEILPFPSAEDIITDEVQSFGCIGPGGYQSLAIELGPLIEADAIAISNRTSAIYVAGRVEYEDAFKRPQWLTFRAFYGGPLGPSDNEVMASAPEGNDASR